MSIRDEFEKAKAEAKAIVEKAKSEARGLTDDEKAETEKRFSRMSDIKATLDVEKRFDLDLPAESTVAADAVKAVATASTFSREPMNEKKPEVDAAEGVRHFARSGDVAKFALTSGTAGGILVPTTVLAPVVVRQPVNAIRKGLNAIGFSTNVSSSTANVNQPFFDDSENLAVDVGNGYTGAANSESECNPCRGADPVVTSKPVALVERHSIPMWYSKHLIQAETFDITANTGGMLASRIERQEEADWMSFIMANAPTGITTASGSAIAASEWQAFDESLPVAYDGLPAFYVTSKAGRLSLRGLKDLEGRYILDFTNNVYTLFGKPLFISANMPGLAKGNLAALLIVGEAIFVRDVPGDELVRYEGESAHPNQIGFELFRYSGFNFGGNGVRALYMNSTASLEKPDPVKVVEPVKVEVKADEKK